MIFTGVVDALPQLLELEATAAAAAGDDSSDNMRNTRVRVRIKTVSKNIVTRHYKLEDERRRKWSVYLQRNRLKRRKKR